MKIPIKEWQTIDGLKLEDAALKAVKSTGYNSLVTAGPGAGKTELLAQKACFLLQTNVCPYPKHILAISFKRDSARNLYERVKQRCTSQLSDRFTSVTFDTFSKSILDRFIQALPESYKLNNNYEILFDFTMIEEEFKSLDYTFGNTRNRNELINYMIQKQLPFGENAEIYEDYLAFKVWSRLLNSKTPKVSFPMISRLAELIINTNLEIKKYLNITYSHIFLDEFQDTTFCQYDLLKACFNQITAEITAVGDNKQRIMTWAGAKRDVFETYTQDFNATPLALLMNYRSTPKIIALQQVLMEDLMNSHDKIQHGKSWENIEGNIEFWFNNSDEKEAQTTARNIKEILEINSLQPRDVCIIVKQQVPKYAEKLINELIQLGIKARNEQVYQDLLTEELVIFVINFLLVANTKKSPNEYLAVLNFISKVRDIDSEQGIAEEVKLKNCLESIKTQGIDKIKCQDDLEDTIQSIIDYLGIKTINSYYHQYRDLSWVRELKKEIAKLLYDEYLKIPNWVDAIRYFKGENSIPIMTIHKSKGLEYHTVIFLGLEDNAFWSFKNQPEEDTCAFFVGMSRAKVNLIFTFSKLRNNRTQSIEEIGGFYKILQKSKLVTLKDYSK